MLRLAPPAGAGKPQSEGRGGRRTQSSGRAWQPAAAVVEPAAPAAKLTLQSLDPESLTLLGRRLPQRCLRKGPRQPHVPATGAVGSGGGSAAVQAGSSGGGGAELVKNSAPAAVCLCSPLQPLAHPTLCWEQGPGFKERQPWQADTVVGLRHQNPPKHHHHGL
jgi:hypothetical protein